MNEPQTILQSPVGVHASACPLPSDATATALTAHNPALLQRRPGKRTRHGKIARLPKDLREMVNRLLHNNVPYARIVSALANHDVAVTERNVSNWKIYGG